MARITEEGGRVAIYDNSDHIVVSFPSRSSDEVEVGGGASTLEEVLTEGNDANGLNIIGVGDLAVEGLTGATQASRYVGATSSGAPASGTFAVGDFVIAQDGNIFVCTSAGTPGTWVNTNGRVARARAVYGGITQYSIPGPFPAGDNSTFTKSNGRAEYQPFVVDTPIVVDQLVTELITGVAASTCRMSIYPADSSWQPTTLVAGTDSGAFNTTAADQGVIAKTISDTTLLPGRYLFWMNCSTGNPVFRSIRGNAGPLLGYPVALGSNCGFTNIYVTQAYGAPPSTGAAWDTVSVGAPHTFHCYMFLRIKTVL